MRKRRRKRHSEYSILVVDDEQGIIDSLTVVLNSHGYEVTGVTSPKQAIEEVRNGVYDLMILDFLMQPIHGDEVVRQIRKFNQDIYILLLTGHKDLAPPLETIKKLDIQGYCEKSDRFDQLVLLVESGIKSISQMRTIKKFKDGLNQILLSVPKIYQLQPIGNILEEILVQILPLVNSKNAFILIDDIMNINNKQNGIFRGLGIYKKDIEDFLDLLSPKFIENIGIARSNKKTVYANNGIILPLINDFDEAVGILFVESKNVKDWERLLCIYANQAASSINNAYLHSLVKDTNDELKMTYDELRKSYMETIQVLRLAVDAKDIYTRGHSDRVAFYAEIISKKMNLPEETIKNIKIGGIFHDIGKIGTADDILLKSDKLNANEFDEIKKHPAKGAFILSAVSMFSEIVPMVKCHHEWINGSGYPEGLKGDDIPIEARIISIADAFDAMLSDRQYRVKLNLDDAVIQLKEGKDIQFDGKIVDILIELLDERPNIVDEALKIDTSVNMNI